MSRSRAWRLPLWVLAALSAARVQGDRCPARRPALCDELSNQYRTYDGSCNNQVDTSMGMSSTNLLRVLQPDYANGIHSPRGSRAHRVLPSARRLVTTLHKDKDVPSKVSNIMVMTWAQLLSHDVSQIQASFPRREYRVHECTARRGYGVVQILRDLEAGGQCCSADNVTDTCDRISVPADDPFYSRFGVRCIGVERSGSSPCATRAHEQVNLVTHWLDASFVYGSTQHAALHLRERRGGRLRTQFIQAEEFLPRSATGRMEAGRSEWVAVNAVAVKVAQLSKLQPSTLQLTSMQQSKFQPSKLQLTKVCSSQSCICQSFSCQSCSRQSCS
ncbi:Chorion peroxidase [Frankliniella fusca]|uniref:Chorion peroxidase n=1 Tax=Frankliniella fusca TaxID=407009 RepID=A0AAE1LQC9_9NEOP|nr:Chorion peroxidase [Frankliniella fusca]